MDLSSRERDIVMNALLHYANYRHRHVGHDADGQVQAANKDIAYDLYERFLADGNSRPAIKTESPV